MRSFGSDDPVATYADVLDALPIASYVARPDGRVTFVSERCCEVSGLAAEAMLDFGYLAAIHPDHLPVARIAWAAATGSESPYASEFQVRFGDGAYRWVRSEATPMRDARDEGVVGWFGTLVDIDDRRRADETRERFVALAENSDDFIATADAAGNVAYLNAAGRRMIDLDPSVDVRARRLSDFFAPDERAALEDRILPALARAGRFVGDARLRNARTGATVPIACNVFTLAAADGTSLGTAAIGHDRRQRERMERGLRLLSRTGAAALDSLDYAQTLENIARAFVEEFASYCIIDSMDAQQRWERTAVHRDPDLQPIISELSPPSIEHPIARALYSGESSVVTVDERWTLGLGDDVERISAVRALAVRSFVTVPIFTPLGDVVGALTTALDANETRENYRDDDLAFVEEVGRRAGAAFANARLYERERRIALELQSASLPAALPRTAELELDAEYRPGSAEATIGGDWYDAFALDDGRVAISVGDVLGHGLHAAVTMTKLRQAMQAAAMLSPDPGAMLAVADKTLRLIDPDAYATAVAAIYDPAAGTLAYASAGHPGPIMREPGGALVDLTRSGLLLGLRDGGAGDGGAVVSVPAGTTIVFFTDGLIEATRDIEDGQRRLQAALRDGTIVRGDGGARRIVERVLAGEDAADDIAVLVAKVGHPPPGDRRPGATTVRVEEELASVRAALERASDPHAIAHLHAKLQILKIDADAERRRRERAPAP